MAKKKAVKKQVSKKPSKGAKGKKDVLSLTREETLELTNIQLRSTLLEQQRQQLSVEQQQWAQKVAARLEINIEEYSINISAGVVTRLGNGGKK